MPLIFGYGTRGRPLSREDELAAIEAWRVSRCQRSIARLLRAHIGIARSAARRWTSDEAALADLVQHGAMAIVRAAERYDASFGVPFSAFCREPVRSAVAAGAPSVLSVVGLPRRVWSGRGRAAAPEGDMRGLPSLDAPSGAGVPLGETVRDGAPSPERLAHCASVERGVGETVARTLAALPPIEAEVYRRRRMLESPDAVEDVCAALHLSRATAGRIEERTSRLVADAVAAAGWRAELAA